MQKRLCLLVLPLLLPHVAQAQEKSELALRVMPAFKWTTEAVPYGDIRLTNEGTATAEITISTTSLDAPPEASASIGDLSPHLTVFPPRMIIPPGESRILRYAIMDTTPLDEGGHVALIKAGFARRTPVSQLQIPAAAASVRLNYELVVPLVLLKGVGEPEIVAQIVSQDPDKLILNLNNHGNSPWAGTIHLSSEDGQQSFGAETGVIFLERELEITLQAPLPDSFHVVFVSDLTWIPEHSLRTPSPIPVPR